MSSKEKENKLLQERLRQFFRLNRGSGGGNRANRDEFVLTEEMQRELSRESANSTRTKAIRDLCDMVTTCKIDDTAAAKIWGCIQDLLLEQSADTRHAALYCLQCLIGGQSKRLNVFRAQIFRIIVEHKHPEDVVHRFDLLQALTENGKDILHFEERMAPFLLDWFPDITKAGKTLDFMGLLVNLIKFNSAHINEEVITGFVSHICILCCSQVQQQIVLSGLLILETIIAYYCNLPSDSLPQFISALCRVVNGEPYCPTAWKVMRNLLGTHMGHSAIFTMCRILQEPALQDDAILIRGAVFYINMGLWSAQPVPNLRCPPSSVLPSILQAVKSKQPLVMYEVMLSMQRLIDKHGFHLLDPSWQTLLQIISIIVAQLELEPRHACYTLVSNHLHETLTTIENLIEAGKFNGNETQFYQIIEECAPSRPETSVMQLIRHLSENINPSKSMWLSKLNSLLNRYYKFDKEKRTNIRLKVLDVLSHVVQLNRMQYEDELIDRIVVPHLINLPSDTDHIVRSAGADLLIDLCVFCDSKRCLEMLDILEKLLNRPFEIHANDSHAAVDVDTVDVKRVVVGLVRVFIVKIHKLPSLHAVRIYKMLVNHLELHYSKPKVFENCNNVRIKIFECFLNMRADNLYRLGCPDVNGMMRYSPYLCVTYQNYDRSSIASPPPVSPAIMQQAPCTITYVPMKAGFKIFLTCLALEKDWDVLNCVLNRIPEALENKPLILAKHGNNDIGLLVDTICTRIENYKRSDSSNANINRVDFFSSVLMVLPGLASYHSYLDASHQQKMIRLLCSFKCGLGRPCFRQCITVLTTCTLEMQDVMVKKLPEVLLILSKSSATVHIAIPVLEFLSTLTILPSVFSNFVSDQYMAIFAMLLPYTNPFKYNEYTVFLAHHVIAVWFLKCRLPFRKEFVRFITKGLQTNAMVPFEESQIKMSENLSRLNQDSSDRKRSSSLTEQRSTRRERASTVVGKPNLDFKPPTIDKSLIPFYSELTETCIDLMARYTFSPCSALPKRLPNAEFLLCGGQSMSWLLGNRVVTVTTSGCSQEALKHGLCDKCYSLCRFDSAKESDDHFLKTSRSGSHEKDDSTRVTRQNSGSNNNTSASSPIEEDKLEQLPSKLQQLAILEQMKKNEKRKCVCWCQGWAEIYVRRPTGNMSWIMRIQNQTSQQHSIYDFPLNEVSTVFMPSLNPHVTTNMGTEVMCRQYSISDDVPNKPIEEFISSTMPISIPGSPNKHSPSRQSSRDSIDEDFEHMHEDGGKVRNPVRRSNSSPEMSANWKNQFLIQKQEREREESRVTDEEGGKKASKKDMRVSCEAIPEEIAGMGTTPPSHDPVQQGNHPSLLSSLSCPGPTNQNEPVPISKAYQTVPPSPNIAQYSGQHQAPTYPSKAFPGMIKTKTDSVESIGSDRPERPTNLPTLNLMPVVGKPPQSPTQTSPRLSRHNLKDGHEIQKSSSLVLQKQKDKKHGIETAFNQSDQNLNTQMRDRSHTIPAISPVRKPRFDNMRHEGGRSKDMPRSGINPSFVFLQLYHAAQFGNSTDKPLLINSSDVVQRALKVLDRIPPYETHQIGVIYIGQGQASKETEILRNKYGSVRYVDFLRKLGTLIKLQDVDPQVFFLGSLDQNGGDGKFAYIWQDDIIRVMFHVATLMPNKDSDPNCNNKKAHIGNNNVTIVYNESGEDYNINTIKGQFNFACIIIHPLDHNSNKVIVKAKDELVELIGNSEPKIVSDQNVAILARQLALHANLASLVHCKSRRNSNSDPYAPNWLERLRRIKTLRKKILQESKRDHPDSQVEDYSAKTRRGQMEDFTEYT